MAVWQGFEPWGEEKGPAPGAYGARRSAADGTAYNIAIPGETRLCR